LTSCLSWSKYLNDCDCCLRWGGSSHLCRRVSAPQSTTQQKHFILRPTASPFCGSRRARDTSGSFLHPIPFHPIPSPVRFGLVSDFPARFLLVLDRTGHARNL
ncbi:unnamed protein product, partial [Ascophyllum nodosum]